MSFISEYIKKLALKQVLALALVTTQKPGLFARFSEAAEPTKKNRYEEIRRLIKSQMSPLLKTCYKEVNFIPTKKVNSWDSYVITSFFLNIERKLIREFSKKLQNLNLDERKIKEHVTKWLESSTVRSGLNTAFLYLFSFLRVIPILLKNTSPFQGITKDSLVKTLTHKTTKKLLLRFMMINAEALNVLQNILWQKPVATLDEAIGNINMFKSFDNFEALMSMSGFSKMNKFFNPENFKLTKNGGLEFSESGELYFKAATQLFPEKALGCPASLVSGSIKKL